MLAMRRRPRPIPTRLVKPDVRICRVAQPLLAFHTKSGGQLPLHPARPNFGAHKTRTQSGGNQYKFSDPEQRVAVPRQASSEEDRRNRAA